MVVIDRLKKVAQFIPVKYTYSVDDVAHVFMNYVLRLHCVLKNIMSDMDKFTSKFWKELFVGLGTELAFNTTYHPQTNGKIERVNRILEYMLRMYVALVEEMGRVHFVG